MASDYSNVSILHGESDPLNKLVYDVSTSTAIGRGDLLKESSNVATVVTAVGDNDSFIGVSLDSHSTVKTANKLNVLLRGRVNIGCASATYSRGDALKYNAGANDTAWSLTAASSGQDGIMWSIEYAASAVTDLDCAFDAFLVGAGIGSGSGHWEGFAA